MDNIVESCYFSVGDYNAEMMNRHLNFFSAECDKKLNISTKIINKMSGQYMQIRIDWLSPDPVYDKLHSTTTLKQDLMEYYDISEEAITNNENN